MRGEGFAFDDLERRRCCGSAAAAVAEAAAGFTRQYRAVLSDMCV